MEMNILENKLNELRPRSRFIDDIDDIKDVKYNYLKRGYNIKVIDKKKNSKNFFMVREFFENIIFKVLREF